MSTTTEASSVASDRPDSISSTLLERVRARQPEAWQRLVDDQPFFYSLDPSQQPKRISIVRPGWSNGCLGIYQLQGDRLTIHLSKDQLPTDVAAEPQEGEILLVLKRASGVASASPCR